MINFKIKRVPLYFAPPVLYKELGKNPEMVLLTSHQHNNIYKRLNTNAYNSLAVQQM